MAEALVEKFFARQDLTNSASPLVCFSHLRWNFVFQRPQHLMSRAALTRPVYFWEEPVLEECSEERLELQTSREGVILAIPHLLASLSEAEIEAAQRRLLDELLRKRSITDPWLWYYTPQALPFSSHLRSGVIVYDCMDELSAFRGAHPLLPMWERELLGRADLVFTGGFSLYEVKRQQHQAVHPLPSGVDLEHFRQARAGLPEPADQFAIPHPRLGFYGVIDERLDLDLLGGLADARPDWQFVIVGPVVKVDPAALPHRANIHYLGGKTYDELPVYLAGWDVAILPFVRDESTRFISPTKTPEYLAAGRPVVSTPIVDVVRHYGRSRAVGIAGTVREFVAATEHALALGAGETRWIDETDALLATSSWDDIWARMDALMTEHAALRAAPIIAAMPLSRRALIKQQYDVMVVGAGFAGSVMAERLAAGGSRVLLIDRRDHIGGNAYDHHDAAGLLIHRYGPHIFHTNSEHITRYLSHFTLWRPYEHRVLAHVRGALLPIPINRTTVNRFFGLDLAEDQVASFLASKAEKVNVVRSSEDVVLGAVGRELYMAFFRFYTQKQWGVDPSALDKSVTARIPTRTNDDDRYFTDSFQAMPKRGFTRMFETMLDNSNITLMLGTDYSDVRDRIPHRHLIFTGPVDEYFGYRFGKLPYRSLRFCHETLDEERHQPVAVINYPSAEVPYTRVTEFKHLTGQRHPKTSICYEFPSDSGDPYYPVPRAENAALYEKYQALADATPDVTFVGRLATYRYYNMDQVVGQALVAHRRLVARGVARSGLPNTSRTGQPAAGESAQAGSA
jgi:UDP-galactopyranose mutase